MAEQCAPSELNSAPNRGPIQDAAALIKESLVLGNDFRRINGFFVRGLVADFLGLCEYMVRPQPITEELPASEATYPPMSPYGILEQPGGATVHDLQLYKSKKQTS